VGVRDELALALGDIARELPLRAALKVGEEDAASAF
jgi:hypothetical protein